MSYEYKHFCIDELVDKHTLLSLGEENCWKLFDTKALKAIDQLREEFGSVTINSWKWGGSSQWRGFRTQNCGIGASRSMHKVGKAFDLSFKNYTAEEVRKKIKKNESFWTQYISRIENNVSWLHIDVKETETPIRWFNP